MHVECVQGLRRQGEEPEAPPLAEPRLSSHNSNRYLHLPPPPPLSAEPSAPPPNMFAAPPSSAEPRRWPCPHCPLSLSSTSNRARHVQNVHPEAAGRKKLPCAFCPATCWTPQLLQLHTSSCPGLHASAAAEPSPSPPAADAEGSDSEESAASSPASPSASSSASSASAPPPLPPVRGLPSALTAPIDDEAFTAAATAFLQSLRPTEKQLPPIRSNLRFLLDASGTRQLSALVQPAVVDALLSGLVRCGKGAARVYALSLLLRKVVAYLCSQQSAASMAYISPSSHPASAVVDEHAARAGRKRKLVQRDRMAFGGDEEEWMTAEEMTIVMTGCLADMRRLEHVYRAGGRNEGALQQCDAEWWTKCWVVVLFITLISPRSQTMASLTTSTVLSPGAPGNSNPEQYLVRVSAELNKAEQAFICEVPKQLTAHMTFFLRRVLPPGHEGALFRTRSGKTRTDFGETTRPVCTKFLGRPINPHRVRTSVATAMWENPAVDEGLMRGLASHMTHSSAVQQQFYAKQKRLKTGAALQSILMAGLRWGEVSGGVVAAEGESSAGTVAQ